MNKTKNINRIASRFAYKFGKIFLIIGAVFAIAGTTNASAQMIDIKCKNQLEDCKSACDSSMKYSLTYADSNWVAGASYHYQCAHLYLENSYYGDCEWKFASETFSHRKSEMTRFGNGYCYSIQNTRGVADVTNHLKSYCKGKSQLCYDACMNKNSCVKGIYEVSVAEILKHLNASSILNSMENTTFKAKMLSAIPDGDQQFKAKVMTLLPSNKIAEMYDPNFVYQ